MLLKLITRQKKDIFGLCVQWHSNFYTSAKCYSAGLLGKLRKTTGFPINKCKAALVKFDNDIKEAEKWLREEAQKEGWAKATKLQGRPMSEGLIGVIAEGGAAAMVEVNCETDFVARNENFQSLVSKCVSACLQHGANSGEMKIEFDKESLAKVALGDSTVADTTALAIGNMGENMSARRAVYYKCGDKMHMSFYVHSADTQKSEAGKCLMGKYGALMLIQQTEEPVATQNGFVQTGRKLCQHVVGMNPKTIGTLEDLEKLQQAKKEEDSSSSSSSSSEDSSSDDDDDDETQETQEEESETVLLKQEFLLDPTMRVGELTQEAGITILDFVRYQCGEELPDETETDQS